MGCIETKSRKTALLKGQYQVDKKKYSQSPQKAPEPQDEISEPEKPPRPEFSEKQKNLVVQTWNILRDDLAKIGVVMFMKLFETHPDVQDVFMPFKGMAKEDMQHSSQLRAHALRVMDIVEKCLAEIDDSNKVEAMLHELGSRHVMYNAKVDYIDLIGPQFIWAIQPAIGDHWNQEVEEAWSDFFKLISFCMKEAMTF